MIALLIPTLNRSPFIIRYLNYLKDNHFEGAVFIGDSSNDQHFNAVKNTIAKLNCSFAIKHLAYPGLKHFECIRKMAPMVQTPYAIYICDDDLLVLGTLKEAMVFLENNPDYSCVTGVGICFTVKTNQVHGPIGWISPYLLRGIEDDSASKRLASLFENYSVVAYSVSRTKQFQKKWIEDSQFNDKSLAVEALPCALSAIQGKIKKLNRLFVVRQLHIGHYPLDDDFDQFTHPAWNTSYAIFRDLVVKELMATDSLSREDAYVVFKRVFWKYLWMQLSYSYPTVKGSVGMVRKIIRRFKYFFKGIHKFHERWFFILHRLSLNTLLPVRPAYSKDFMPVYKAVVKNSI